MNLFIRFIRIIIHALFRSKIGVFEDSIVTFRVFPHDLDYNLHMTNSRYHSMTDLARVDRLIRSDMNKFLSQNQYGTVLGSSYIRFRRSLPLFQKVTIRTRFLGYDEKWFYIEHYFESKGALVASSIVKAIFTKNGKSIPVVELLKEFAPDADFSKYTNLPQYVHDWVHMECNMKQALAEEYTNDA
jgi:acyl-CoA thioesterase FadM